MRDLTTDLRRAVLAELRNHPGLLELVPKASIYRQTAPANAAPPFVKPGTMIATPGPTLGGERIRLPIFVVAGARKQGAKVVEFPEDHIGRIVANVKDALSRRILATPSGQAKLRLVNDIRRQRDGQADVYEANIEFEAKMLA